MAYTDTEVYLINVPLDSENNHTYFFDNAEDQITFFKSKVKHQATNLSYQRKDNKIRYPKQYDSICDCNYVMYRNQSYSNKWYYAFIKEFQHNNDGTTDIIIETDAIQTYLFDYIIGQCFVEREHVNDDTIGLHTIPEALETGEYVCNDVKTDEGLKECVFVMLATEDDEGNAHKSTNFGGIPVAGGAYILTTPTLLTAFIHTWDTKGKGEAIQAVYMIPSKVLDWNGSALYEGKDEPAKYDFFVDKPSSINGYKPHNNKLFTYPYQYLVISNNAGASNVLQFEHFNNDDDQCVFEVKGVGVIGGSIKASPKNYKGKAIFEDEGIMCGKYPVLSWSSDLFVNWCTQNAVNISLSTISSGASMIAGGLMMATGVGGAIGAGMLAGGAMGIAKQMGEIYEHSLTPDSARGNINGGDITSASKTNTFFYNSMSIKQEYAKIIDKFFDVYGYKVNMVKVPNKDHRSNYWYTKTQEAYVYGNIPESELQKIRNCYNKGITFWRANKIFRNYSTNTIL